MISNFDRNPNSSREDATYFNVRFKPVRVRKSIDRRLDDPGLSWKLVRKAQAYRVK